MSHAAAIYLINSLENPANNPAESSATTPAEGSANNPVAKSSAKYPVAEGSANNPVEEIPAENPLNHHAEEIRAANLAEKSRRRKMKRKLPPSLPSSPETNSAYPHEAFRNPPDVVAPLEKVQRTDEGRTSNSAFAGIVEYLKNIFWRSSR